MPWHDWESLATTDFADPDVRAAVVVLPVAAVEQHGAHLPLGTDAILTDGLLAAALDALPSNVTALRLPIQRIGASVEHTRFAGTLSLAPDLVLAQWTAIGRAVAAAGPSRLLILNGHGGQIGLVDMAARQLRADCGMTVVRATYFTLLGQPDGVDERELRYGLHGGQVETALMMAIAPGLVRSSAVRDFPSTAETLDARFEELQVEGETGLGWMAEDLNMDGVTGNAGAATEELGRRILDGVAGRLATLIAELHDFEGFSD